jgi:hypothetical protein
MCRAQYGGVPASAVSSETLTSRLFAGQSRVLERRLAVLSDMLTNSHFAEHSREVGRATVGLSETRTCRRTAEPSRGDSALKVKKFSFAH